MKVTMLAMSPHQATLPFAAFSQSAPPQEPQTDTEGRADESCRTHDLQNNQVAVDLRSRESTPLSITTTLSSYTPLKTEGTSGDMGNPKKRKMTDIEREVLEIEKRHKQLEKEAERARKEEARRVKEEEKDEKKRLKEQEKAVKDAERLIKDAEKEEKRRQKEAERLMREEEKRLKDEAKEVERKAKEDELRIKEEEKQKKEKAQLRLNSFFTKPAPPAQLKTITKPESKTTLTTISVNNESVEVKRQSEFERAFPPFFLHAHTTIAPRADSAATKSQSTGDWLQAGGFKPTSLLDALPPRKRRCRRVLDNVKTIIENLSKPDQALNADSQHAFQAHYQQVLKEVPIKTLKFAEDVRPPYIGTATKETSLEDRRRLRRNPCSRALPILNYDYDSEAEWEEPEEGEDLGSEDEEEANDDDEEDMDGFLDDADTDKPARRQALGDIEVVTTGLIWETCPRNHHPIAFGDGSVNMQTYRMQSLLPSPMTSIDPFSTAYWPSENKNSSSKSNDMAAPATRTPLSTLKSAGNLPINAFLVSPNVKQDHNTQNSVPFDTNAKPTILQARAKPIPSTMLEPFRACILENAEHTKLGLIEILKKNFPTLTKSTVQETLLNVAKREGKSNNEKKWILCA